MISHPAVIQSLRAQLAASHVPESRIAIAVETYNRLRPDPADVLPTVERLAYHALHGGRRRIKSVRNDHARKLLRGVMGNVTMVVEAQLAGVSA